MTKLPDVVAKVWRPMPASIATEQLDGQQALEEFESAVAAYEFFDPGAEERMLSAYRKFQRLGYEAYFLGQVDAPPLIAARPYLALMWNLGYDIAECDAVNRLCKCDCDKCYVWGRGYAPCPHAPKLQRK
jgi:hypothetical protein